MLDDGAILQRPDYALALRLRAGLHRVLRSCTMMLASFAEHLDAEAAAYHACLRALEVRVCSVISRTKNAAGVCVSKQS